MPAFFGGDVSVLDADGTKVSCKIVSFTYVSGNNALKIDHGLSGKIILGFSIGVRYSENENESELIPPYFDDSSDYYYQAYIGPNEVTIRRDGRASKLDGRACTCMIWYVN